VAGDYRHVCAKDLLAEGVAVKKTGDGYERQPDGFLG
jgi:hypothetical protein